MEDYEEKYSLELYNEYIATEEEKKIIEQAKKYATHSAWPDYRVYFELFYDSSFKNKYKIIISKIDFQNIITSKLMKK